MSHGERIAQCEHIKMYTTKTLPIQIDGEPCKLQPSIIEVIQKNTAQVIRKVPRKNIETPLTGVAPTEQIKMSVSKVTREQYHQLNRDVHELRRVAAPLGLIMTSVEDTLDAVRRQVEGFTALDDSEDGSRPLGVNWRFLETNISGLYEQMFQLTPDQEHSITIGNMPSDGIIVMEMDSVPSRSHAAKFSPEEDMAEHPLTSLPEEGAGSEPRQIGRNHSYRRATSPGCDVCPLPPPQVFSVAASRSPDLKLQVPGGHLNHKRGSVGSNHSEEGYEGDSDNFSPGPLRNIDMGSDSTGGDTDAGSAPSSVQKALIDAVKRGQIKKVQHYHAAGAKLTVTDANGLTALHHAARLGKDEIVKYLADHCKLE
jgi:diacylglycerol kinase (ATP)